MELTKEQKAIRRKAAAIEKKLEYWYLQEAALRDSCPHINKTTESFSNTGNWCKQDDYYWNEHRCPDCGKFWSETVNHD